jgi:hypothetical protein
MLIRLPLPPQDELLATFSYDPTSGFFAWRVPRQGRLSGQHAGTRTRHKGFRVVIDGKQYSVHRIIWKMIHNEEPIEIDHIDGDEWNNSLTNLRAATTSQNQMNKGACKNNKLGVKGVHYQPSRQQYRATIYLDGRIIFLGRFHELDDAKAAYATAVAKYHGEFGRVA